MPEEHPEEDKIENYTQEKLASSISAGGELKTYNREQKGNVTVISYTIGFPFWVHLVSGVPTLGLGLIPSLIGDAA